MLNQSLVLQISLMAILLTFSAFFSGSETALFSLNSLEKDSLRRNTTGKRSVFVQLLFSQPDEILVTILTGNMFVNILSSSIAGAVGDRIFSKASEVLSIICMTLILLIFGEMTPKNFAIRHSLRFANFSTSILRFIHSAIKPVTFPLRKIRHTVLSVFPGDRGKEIAGEGNTVLSAIRMGYKSNAIDESELKLLERFFRFRQKVAADLMVPRVKVHPVDSSITISTLIELISSGSLGNYTGLIPVFEKNIDHLTGYVRRIDLVSQRFKRENRQLSEISKPIHAVPAGKRLPELLEEMGNLGTEMAVVVDRYGGTVGILSFPLLVSYLFQDLPRNHELAIKKTGDHSFLIDGHAEIDEVASVLNIELSGTNRTIAGMLLDEFERIPEIGQETVREGYIFRVAGVTDRSITLVEAERAES
jgi:CBS domain containing-hemolysin-like protein